MNYRINFSPEETFLILQPNAKLRDLLKFTFISLINQKVLTTTKANGEKDPSSFDYITIGANFGRQKPKEHEIPFLRPFTKSRNISYLFKQYLKLIFEYVDTTYYTKKCIRATEQMAPLYKTDFISRILFQTNPTNQGKDKQAEIKKNLSLIEKDFEELFKKDQEAALKLIIGLGGNMCHLKNFDFSLLKRFDERLIKKYESNWSDYDHGNWYLHTVLYDLDYDNDFDMHDNYFDSVSDSFDSYCTSDSTSFDSGCSSCSGCGGCGGCGGCS